MPTKTSAPIQFIDIHLTVALIVVPILVPATYALLILLSAWFPSLNPLCHFAQGADLLTWLEECIGVIIKFAIWAAIYWAITLSFLNWDRNRFNVYCSFGIFLWFVGFIQWSLWFDSFRWKISNSEARYSMVNNLIERQLLIGKTEKEVIEMLGEPGEQVIPSNDRLEYSVWDGASTSKYGEAIPSYLVLKFGSKSKVTSVKFIELP